MNLSAKIRDLLMRIVPPVGNARGGKGYLQGAGLVVLVTLASYLTQSFLDPFNSALLYVLCIVITAILRGFGPSILVCVLSILAHEILYIVTFQNFGPPDWDNVPTLTVLLLVGMTVSYLAAQVQTQTEKARRREQETRALYLLSRNLAATDNMEDSIRIILKAAKEIFGYEAAIYLPGAQDRQISNPVIDGGLMPGDDPLEIARWSMEHQKEAGAGTGMFLGTPAHYVPLITVRGAVGVIAVATEGDRRQLPLEQAGFFSAFADLVAVAIERIAFAEETRDIKLSQAATEKLQIAFLDSISHDLRTPLASVLGALGSLKEEMELDSNARTSLILVANREAENLNQLITNLLDVSRIQAGAIKIARQPCAVNDIISVALDKLAERPGQREIRVDISQGLPFVAAEFGLVVKVLLNLLDNAIKYSEPGSPVEISARHAGDEVEIRVADHGIGVPPQDLPYIFQRFHRAPNSGASGVGLGLSICKGIIEAHGGHITAENRHGGGLSVSLTLPVSGEKGTIS
jgi:two-component system sensor histidine kinase KdpD